MITVVGAGDVGELDGMTVRGLRCIEKARVVVFQSEQQACYIEDKLTLDNVFQEASDFDEFSAKAAEFIIAQGDDTVFVCIGDGVCNNVTRALCKSVSVDIIEGHASISVVTAAKMGLLDMDAIYYINAYDYLSLNVDVNTDLVICQVDSKMLFWDIKARLLDYYPEDIEVVLNKSCTSLECAEYFAPCDIFVPKVNILERGRYSYNDLMEIVKDLRKKCPWDKEQTHKSILPNLIEETYELYDALDNEDSQAILEEMGDVLLQICLHTVFELEHGDISEDEVTTLIAKKLIRRHPHIYGNQVATNQVEVKTNWDNIKKEEYNLKCISDELKHVSKYLPALMRAIKVIKKARKRNIEITGDIQEVLKNIINSVDIENNIHKFSLLFVKMCLDLGQLPYISMNEAVDALIKQVEHKEDLGYIVDEGLKISVDDMVFSKELHESTMKSKKNLKID